jgi:hypothetical protein
LAAIVGNPPYVKHHDIDPNLLRVARRRVAEQGFELSGRSSYWAYFVLHALQFVSPGGKLAFILPGAVLHAEYAASVLEAVLNSFGGVTVVAGFRFRRRRPPRTAERAEVRKAF